MRILPVAMSLVVGACFSGQGAPPTQSKSAAAAKPGRGTAVTARATTVTYETMRRINRARRDELDTYIADALRQLEVPGAAVAIVEGDTVMYEGAFGVRELGRPAVVTPTTLFLIGSITKPMTTMMEAILVDVGVLSWDTPIIRLLPSFALGDPEMTGKLELWHMSCACTGMPRADLENLFEYENVTPESRVGSMQTMKPTAGFGEKFQYSNVMVAAGGFAAAHAFAPELPLADAYAAAMQATTFGPIGMVSTTVDFAVVAGTDAATPHALSIDGQPRPLPLAIERNVLPIAPAGAVWTNLRDMERYVQTELAGGVTPTGRRVVSEKNLLERRIIRVRTDDAGGYGLGVHISKLQGIPTIGHDGGSLGFGSTMLMLPGQGVGIIIFTNVRNGGGYQQLPFNHAVERKIVELLFGSAGDLSSSHVADYVKAKRRTVASSVVGLQRAPESPWLVRLSGTYENSTLGTVVVASDGFDAGEWKTAIGRRTDSSGVVKLVFLDPPFAGGEVVVGGDANDPKLIVEYEQARYVFTRRPG